MLNLTAGWVRWSPPPPQHHNGILLGYKIQVKAGNSSKVLAQMTLNSTTTSVMLNNLTTGATYNARIVAYTRIGAGPYSKPIALVMDPVHLISPPRAHPSGSINGYEGSYRGHSIMHETWFMIIVATALLVILISAIIGAFFFFRKRHQMTKDMGHLPGIKQHEHLLPALILSNIKDSISVPSVVATNDVTAINVHSKDSLWIDRGWRSTDTDKDSGLSEMKLLSNSHAQGSYADGSTDYAEVDSRNITTFYNYRKVSLLPFTL